MTNPAAEKKLGRRQAGTWGRPAKGKKRTANQGVRTIVRRELSCLLRDGAA